jgi:hypothetical protein
MKHSKAGGPDGLKTDENGTLCGRYGGVLFSEGRHLGTIESPEKPSNGGGDNYCTLTLRLKLPCTRSSSKPPRPDFLTIADCRLNQSATLMAWFPMIVTARDLCDAVWACRLDARFQGKFPALVVVDVSIGFLFSLN